MSLASESIRGTAAGVPFVAIPPATRRPDAPVVLAWHLMDPPRSEAAFAAALPLAGLDAWRIYLGLPMAGARLPQGGFAELLRLAREDAVLNVHGPVARQGADELPAALAALRVQLGLAPNHRLAIVGGSAGSAIAQLVLIEVGPRAGLTIDAAVLISPLVQLQPTVEALGRRFGVTYTWGPASRKIAQEIDFVARADEFVRAGQPPLRLIVGANDDEHGFRTPAAKLRDALAARYSDPKRVDLVTIPEMAHALAAEPGIDPAPQTPQAAEVDRLAVDWLRRHLRSV